MNDSSMSHWCILQIYLLMASKIGYLLQQKEKYYQLNGNGFCADIEREVKGEQKKSTTNWMVMTCADMKER